MKTRSLVSLLMFASGAFPMGAALAADDAAKIPAPVVPVVSAAQPPPPSSPIPAPSLAVQPPSTANDPLAQRCENETASRIRAASCDQSVRTYSSDDISRTGETSLGAALTKLDPSVSVRR